MKLLLDQGLPRRSTVLHAEAMAERIILILEAVADELARGAVASVDETNTVRIRKLPL